MLDTCRVDFWTQYDHSFPLTIEFDAPRQTLWISFRADRPPILTYEVVASLVRLFSDLHDHLRQGDSLIRIVGYRSLFPGMFCHGGDLSIYAAAIAGNDKNLLEYVELCTEMLWLSWSLSEKHDVVTGAVFAGNVYGGGFEAGLSCDYIISLAGLKIGCPDIAFGIYGTIGTLPLLARRTSLGFAQTFLDTGKEFSSDELERRGVIDILAHPAPDEPPTLALDNEVNRWQQHVRKNFSAIRARIKCERARYPVARDEFRLNAQASIESMRDADPSLARRLTVINNGLLAKYRKAILVAA